MKLDKYFWKREREIFVFVFVKCGGRSGQEENATATYFQREKKNFLDTSDQESERDIKIQQERER